MRLNQAAAISTAIVVALGIAMAVPAYIPRLGSVNQPGKQQTIMLFFSVKDGNEVPKWCIDLSSFLKTYNMEATVFITGKVANPYPECVTSFPNTVDIGSQTYNYVNLTSISDYTVKLEEVSRGKQAVDKAGKLDSRLFRAPFGSTDDDIYSLLNRSGILADFSYDSQYNKFYNGQFIKFNLKTYRGTDYSAGFFLSLPQTEDPIVIYFDNSTSVEQIRELVLGLRSSSTRFVNASTATGLDLTVRGK